MTTTFITAHGRRFAVEGSGFVRAQAEADFEKIASDIEDALRGLAAAEVERIHTGASIDDETGDWTDAKAFDNLNTLANRKAADVMVSWHNPDGAHVSVSAA